VFTLEPHQLARVVAATVATTLPAHLVLQTLVVVVAVEGIAVLFKQAAAAAAAS
jgi:hypothetical protein